jgi:hypothetical protein
MPPFPARCLQENPEETGAERDPDREHIAREKVEAKE